MSHKHHKVVHHRWIGGNLINEIASFLSFEEARNFAEQLRTNINSQIVKIYNENEELVHSSGAEVTDTYA